MTKQAQVLDEHFKRSGKTKLFLANKLKVSRPRLDAIFEKPDTATVVQAEGLCKELSIKKSDRDFIFLSNM